MVGARPTAQLTPDPSKDGVLKRVQKVRLSTLLTPALCRVTAVHTLLYINYVVGNHQGNIKDVVYCTDTTMTWIKLTGQGVDLRTATTTQTEDEVKRRLLLNVVVAQRTAILKLLTSKDQALLVRGNALLVLNLRLDVLDRVRGLDLERNRLSCQGLNENLHECLV